MRLSLIFMLLIISGSGRATTVADLPSECRQCLVVTVRSWSATEGRLIAFDRANRSGWQRAEIDAEQARLHELEKAGRCGIP